MGKRWVRATRVLGLGLAILLSAGCGGGGGAPAPTVGSLTGRVTNDLAQALAGATVAVTGRSTTTAADGSFTFDNLAPGVYTLAVNLPGHASRNAEATIVAGQQAVVEVILQRVSEPPTATVEATPATLPFAGGAVQVVVRTADSENDPLTVTGAFESTAGGGTVTFTEGPAQTWTGTANLPANLGTAMLTYTFTITVRDPLNTITVTDTVQVQGVAVPETGGGGGGQPPIPNI